MLNIIIGVREGNGRVMRSATGRWVTGDDFFGRDRELWVLETRVRDRNHVLLTGQRRMGKTSIAQELGRRLECEDWVFLFTDIEGATCAEDVVASIARAVHPVRPISSRIATGMRRWIGENVEEVSVLDFGVKIRAGLNAGSWRSFGEKLLGECAAHEKPVLLVLDELPIFLKRMLRGPEGARRVDEFLSWLRGAMQAAGDGSLSLIVAGSIGLQPLVHRLGIPDRINYLDPIRIGPWDQETSIGCFQRLAANYDLRVEDGVAEAVYDALGIGIPHHVQSFFARLRDFAIMHGHGSVTLGMWARSTEMNCWGPGARATSCTTRRASGTDWRMGITPLRWRSSPKQPRRACSLRLPAAAWDSCTPQSSTTCPVGSATRPKSSFITAISSPAKGATDFRHFC